jgi:hypothetical protein
MEKSQWILTTYGGLGSVGVAVGEGRDSISEKREKGELREEREGEQRGQEGCLARHLNWKNVTENFCNNGSFSNFS